MDAGKLNRRIEIRTSTTTVDPTYKTQKLVWSTLAKIWAEVQDVLPSRGEQQVEAINIAARPCRVRMRWRGDVTSAMRLVIADREYRIIAGPADIENRTGIELMAEALTTEGKDG